MGRKAKTDRNERLYKFWMEHQTWPFRSIANLFGISHVRVVQILHEEQKKHEEKADETAD